MPYKLAYFCTAKKSTMDTKLTIRLDKSLIDDAKAFAKSKNMSFTKYIQQLLNMDLSRSVKKKKLEIEITPAVKALMELARREVVVKGEIEFKNEYDKIRYEAIMEKYLRSKKSAKDKK